MKKSEIRVGGIYVAKISGKLVQVRVDAIRDVWTNATNRQGIAYDVTNLSTSRKTTFRAAAKFRGEVGKAEVKHFTDGDGGANKVMEASPKKTIYGFRDEVGRQVGKSVMVSFTDCPKCNLQFEVGKNDASAKCPKCGNTWIFPTTLPVAIHDNGGAKEGEQRADPMTPIGNGTPHAASASTVVRNAGSSARIDCQKCGRCEWDCRKHPSDPAKDEFRCRICKHRWKRYEDEQCSDPTQAKPTMVKLTTTGSSKNGSPKQSRGSSTAECAPSSKPTPTEPAQDAKQPLSGETDGKQNADPIAARPSAPTSTATMAGAGASPASGLAAKLARVEDDSPHLIVEARAGTGKTTTLIEGLKRIKGIPSALIPSPQQEAVWKEMERSKGKIQTICFVAFNKSIAEELKARVPEGCNASTMHSLGYEAVRKAFGRLNVNDWVVRDMIADELGMDWREVTKKPRLFALGKSVEELVGLAKVNLSDCSPDSLLEIADHYRVEEVCDRALEMVPKIIDRCKSPKGRINFDDMIWLPVVLGLPVFRYDLLLVDEAQDLNRCQQALARAAGRRLILCGDARQAIYGFAGADAESLPRMFAELKATPRDCARLPLTVTRRCGKAIVAKASQIVPDFQAFASNPEGKVTKAALPSNRDGGLRAGEQDYAEIAADGDMVLCRINAPLVSECFRFLRAGRKATIQGRDVGKGLIGTCKKLDASDVKDFIHKLGDWLSSEQSKENAKKNPSESRLIGIQDRHDCLLCFASSLPASAPASEVERKIDAIFTDDKKSSGIRLSSIHKAKGLEARRVFILQQKNGPRKDRMKAWELEQESNLRYVAITRAIDTLVYVS